MLFVEFDRGAVRPGDPPSPRLTQSRPASRAAHDPHLLTMVLPSINAPPAPQPGPEEQNGPRGTLASIVAMVALLPPSGPCMAHGQLASSVVQALAPRCGTQARWIHTPAAYSTQTPQNRSLPCAAVRPRSRRPCASSPECAMSGMCHASALTRPDPLPRSWGGRWSAPGSLPPANQHHRKVDHLGWGTPRWRPSR